MLKVVVFSENFQKAERFVSLLKSNEQDSDLTKLNLETKYFSTQAEVEIRSFQEPYVEGSFSAVILDSEEVETWIKSNSELLLQAEYKVLFSNRKELEATLLEQEIEVTYQDLEDFKGFIKEESELVGLSRVREIIECAAAPYAFNEQEDIQSLEAQVDTFEYLLGKVKSTAKEANSLPGEERRQKALDTIQQLMQHFDLD